MTHKKRMSKHQEAHTRKRLHTQTHTYKIKDSVPLSVVSRRRISTQGTRPGKIVEWGRRPDARLQQGQRHGPRLAHRGGFLFPPRGACRLIILKLLHVLWQQGLALCSTKVTNGKLDQSAPWIEDGRAVADGGNRACSAQTILVLGLASCVINDRLTHWGAGDVWFWCLGLLLDKGGVQQVGGVFVWVVVRLVVYLDVDVSAAYSTTLAESFAARAENVVNARPVRLVWALINQTVVVTRT